MDEFKVRLRVKSFKTIEGGRYLRANAARAGLLDAAEDCAFEQPFIAGFAVVTWDDRGHVLTAVHNESHSLMTDADIADFARRQIDYHVSEFGVDETDDEENENE